MEFPPYRLDLADERVWKGDKLLALRRKPFAILRFLAQNPKRLVTHDELLAHVWGGMTVSESAVRSHLHDIRQSLGDGIIETVVGRGYRFVAEVSAVRAAPAPAERPAPSRRPDRILVGRDDEIAMLRAAIDRAASGRRQLCFVSGDPGIGKTSLLDAFIDELEDRGVLAVRGQCVEQFGTPEAYLAMIEVLGKLRRSERGAEILASLTRYAPTFLARMPQLLPDEPGADLLRRAAGGNEARMVRELAEALEAACDQQPIVIVIEDLQWSDVATLDLLALLGQRTERAKLVVIATVRQVALTATDQPLSRIVKTLVARNGATHVPLERIGRDKVAELLARRFVTHDFPSAFIDALALITGGIPLFIVTFIDDLVRRGMLAERDGTWSLTTSVDEIAAYRPDSIKQLIDIQLDRLTGEEQRTLEAASLVGAQFATGPVAAALGQPIEAIDDLCDALARRGQFLKRGPSIELPDGSLQSSYQVDHALVQEVCEHRGSAARRQRWHKAIAEHLIEAYGDRVNANEVATHFDKAALAANAIDYYMRAGNETALRFASRDALALYERARQLIDRLPRSRDRDARELAILSTINQLVIRMPYRGDPIDTYERAIALARTLDDTAGLYASLANMCLRYLTRGLSELCVPLCTELSQIAGATPLDLQLLEYGTNISALVAISRADLTTAISLFDRLAESTAASAPTHALVHHSALWGPLGRTATSRANAGLAYCLRGCPDRALRLAREAIAEGIDGDPISLGIAENIALRIRYLRRDPIEQIEAAARTILQRGTAGGFILEDTRAILRWTEAHRMPLTADEAAAAVAAYKARVAIRTLSTPGMGVPVGRMLHLSGFPAEARDIIDCAIAHANETQEWLHVPDLMRLRADYLEDRGAAIAAYKEAHARAAGLDMPLFELRAAIGLAARDRAAAVPLITAALARCPEQPDLPDFVEARALVS